MTDVRKKAYMERKADAGRRVILSCRGDVGRRVDVINL